MLDPAVGETILKQIIEPGTPYGAAKAQLLFFRSAADEMASQYVEDFYKDPDGRRFIEEKWIAPPHDFESLSELPEESLGKTYYQMMIEHDLDLNHAENYNIAHQAMSDSGMLDDLPSEISYAMLRGHQIHDLSHTITGYPPTDAGEMALQAFGLAQVRHVYGGICLMVLMARATFFEPSQIVPIMTAISHGWEHGRRARNIMYPRWEEMFDRPLPEIRREFGIDPEFSGFGTESGLTL